MVACVATRLAKIVPEAKNLVHYDVTASVVIIKKASDVHGILEAIRIANFAYEIDRFSFSLVFKKSELFPIHVSLDGSFQN